MFSTNQTYTRNDVMDALAIERQQGGIWFTGHIVHNNEHFLFCTIQGAGSTGHDYGNYFRGGELIWHTRKGATLNHPRVAQLVSNQYPVHVFHRNAKRDRFSYMGPVHATPRQHGNHVEVIWTPLQEQLYPDEVSDLGPVYEGAKRQITVNAYERDPTARARCIRRWGMICVVCGFSFEDVYGEIGKEFIHVHHVTPVHTFQEQYELNPEEDLRPVCPNCHAMLHRKKDKLLSIDELKIILNKHKQSLESP